MRSIIFFLPILLCMSCSKIDNDIEVRILNDTLVAYDYDVQKDTINLVKIEIKNNSDEIFYFNDIFNSNELIKKTDPKNSLSKDIFNFKIFDEKNKNVDYFEKASFNSFDSICQQKNRQKFEVELERLDSKRFFRYYSTDKHSRFFINPKQKLYFEIYINFTDTIAYEYDRIRFAKLKNNNSYFVDIFILSDSTNFKFELPRHVLKTIESNNVKVYHGIVKSKSKVPLKVLK